MELDSRSLRNKKGHVSLADHNDTSVVGYLCDHRLLTAEEEVELGKRIQAGDEEALHELILCNVKLVANIAKSHVHSVRYGYPDAVSNGLIGLTEAAKKFDPERGVRFSTLARWEIRMAIQQGMVCSISSSVNVPLGAIYLYYKHLNGEEVKDTRMKTVELVKGAIEAGIGDGEVNDEFTPHYDEPIYPEHVLELFRECFAGLSERDQDILAMTYGLAPYEHPMTREEIAEKEGITPKSAKSRETVARKRLELLMKNHSSKFQLEPSN